MRIYRFAREVGQPIERFESQGFVFAPILHEAEQAYAGCVYLEPHGRIGCHEATMDQLLLVVQGGGAVSGAEGTPEPVGPGCAVFWEQGEWHETWAGGDGLVAVVIEGREFFPARSMPLRDLTDPFRP